MKLTDSQIYEQAYNWGRRFQRKYSADNPILTTLDTKPFIRPGHDAQYHEDSWVIAAAKSGLDKLTYSRALRAVRAGKPFEEYWLSEGLHHSIPIYQTLADVIVALTDDTLSNTAGIRLVDDAHDHDWIRHLTFTQVLHYDPLFVDHIGDSVETSRAANIMLHDIDASKASVNASISPRFAMRYGIVLDNLKLQCTEYIKDWEIEAL